jgi:ankyrin repeat protein
MQEAPSGTLSSVYSVGCKLQESERRRAELEDILNGHRTDLRSGLTRTCEDIKRLQSADPEYQFFDAIERNDIARLTELLKSGFNVNVWDHNGYTGLYWATNKNLLPVVEFLLRHGADPNGGIRKPLTVAARSGYIDIAKLLVAHGARIEYRPGDNPLVSAAWAGHVDMVKLLVIHGADPKRPKAIIMASRGCRIDVVRELISAGADVNQKDKFTAPLIAATEMATKHGKQACIPLIRLLLDNGADVSVRDHRGLSARDYALRSENQELLRLIDTRTDN